jgi:hypothetical protein
MKLSKEEVLEIALDFDNRVRRGMTIATQIEFLVDNYATLSDEYEIGKIEESGADVQNGWRCLPPYFCPLSMLFETSSLVWDVYRPEYLLGLSPRQLAILATIGSSVRHIHYLSNVVASRFQTIIAASHVLPPETRAYFCAARMDGFLWTESRLFFSSHHALVSLQAKMRGEPVPEYPRGFVRRTFYEHFSPSFGLKLPQALQDAIAADNPARFGITMTMCNKQLSKNLVLHLLDREAIQILLADFAAVKRHLPLDELAFYCASSLNLPLALPLLAEIEKSAKGALRDATDIFGNNALWYLLYRNESSDYPSVGEDATAIDRIETLLLEHGCDPDQPNCLELTYNAIKAARAILRDALWLCR